LLSSTKLTISRTIQASQSVIKDFPDLKLTTGRCPVLDDSGTKYQSRSSSSGLEVIAGLLYVPLSRAGRDFIAFLRRGQPKQVNWAGRPLRDGQGAKSLEPRSSFKIWSETVAGRCRAWTDEQLETAGVLALVYGKVCSAFHLHFSMLKITARDSSSLSGGKSKRLSTPTSWRTSS
jgi:Phytochrome region